MYLRTTTRRTRDGSVVRYVQLAHNRRVNGVTQAHVLVNLGREEHLDLDGLRRLVGSIQRWLGDDGGTAPGGPAAADLKVVDVRPVGAVWLLDGLWTTLGVDAALQRVVGPRRWTPDVDRVAFAAVALRAVRRVDPPPLADWVARCVLVPGLETMREGELAAVADLVGAALPDPGVLPVLAGERPLPPAGPAGRRAHGHAVLDQLACALVRTVERRTGRRWPSVRDEVDRVCAVTVSGRDGATVLVGGPDGGHGGPVSAVFAACAVPPPPDLLDASVGGGPADCGAAPEVRRGPASGPDPAADG